ncbi:hypothetical protein Hamer_G016856 [Homarus americanus]|uniref:Uncharacterized protein n=1 Tax=Homarus americanus TaxID=6706 RepID=A0A8J5MYV2_HOMAM|nr:hypothetical protein Hamer_G016856 [Homarus americanus]
MSKSGYDDTCLFCEQPTMRGKPLRKASPMKVYSHMKQCAQSLQDERIMTKLSQWDVIALEAKYHLKCLVAFYTRDRPSTSQKNDPTAAECNTEFAELCSYMREVLEKDACLPVVCIEKYLMTFQQLSYLNEDKTPSFHVSRFKNIILSYFPELE